MLDIIRNYGPDDDGLLIFEGERSFLCGVLLFLFCAWGAPDLVTDQAGLGEVEVVVLGVFLGGGLYRKKNNFNTNGLLVS